MKSPSFASPSWKAWALQAQQHVLRAGGINDRARCGQRLLRSGSKPNMLNQNRQPRFQEENPKSKGLKGNSRSLELSDTTC